MRLIIILTTRHLRVSLNIRKSVLLITLLRCTLAHGDIVTPVDSTSKVAFHLHNTGTLGGKIDSDPLAHRGEPLNNHGYFYNGSLLQCSVSDKVALKTQVRIWNEELSVNDQYRFRVEPEIALHLRARTWETNFRGGFFDSVTIGSGLTLKDFSNSGAIVDVRWNKLMGSAAIFSRGYGSKEDIYFIGLHPLVIPLKVTALVIYTQGVESVGLFTGNRYYLTGYLLPDFEYASPVGKVYAEYGFKYAKSMNVKAIIEESPMSAHAGLIGFTKNHAIGRLTMDGCLELRAYQKGFIPVTGVDESRFVNLWHEDDSRANWIDFFDSRETSFWTYAQVNADILICGGFRLFFHDEMLYFHSKQKEVIVYPYYNSGSGFNGAVMRYKPSTNFYSAGVRYIVYRGISGELSIGNKLINHWQFYITPYSQWGQRFIASDRPFFEGRIRWNF